MPAAAGLDTALVEKVAAAVPRIPAGMSDRLDESWEVPLAIAEVISDKWSEQARNAALAISGQLGTEDESVGTQLLADIRRAFAQKEQEDQKEREERREQEQGPEPEDQEPEGSRRGPRLSSDQIITFLTGLEDRPWAEISRHTHRKLAIEARNRGRPLTALEPGDVVDANQFPAV